MRSRFCRVCKDFHDVEAAWPEACAGHFGQPTRSGPQIISDTIEPFRNMATGEMFSSKSRYRADLKARELIEVGNDRQTQRQVSARPVRDTIRETYHRLQG